MNVTTSIGTPPAPFSPGVCGVGRRVYGILLAILAAGPLWRRRDHAPEGYPLTHVHSGPTPRDRRHRRRNPGAAVAPRPSGAGDRAFQIPHRGGPLLHPRTRAADLCPPAGEEPRPAAAGGDPGHFSRDHLGFPRAGTAAGGRLSRA